MVLIIIISYGSANHALPIDPRFWYITCLWYGKAGSVRHSEYRLGY